MIKPCPGSKIKSKGKGKGLGTGKQQGPIGSPSKTDRSQERNKLGKGRNRLK